MHSFDNGTSTKVRSDNWAQLDKLFKKKNIAIQKKAIDDVLANKPDASLVVVHQLYTALTARRYVF